MSLYGALRSGVSGLFVQTQSMAMISDNIANVNTNGYKMAAPRFSTLVTTASSNTYYTSGGTNSNVAREIDQQGLLKGSSVATDIAISQGGFFTVTDSIIKNKVTNDWDSNGTIHYTRAGEFRKDKSGNLVNSAGFYLMGWKRNDTNDGYKTTNVQSSFNGINVAAQSAVPQPTSSINFSANLNSESATGDTFKTEIQVFDRQGKQKSLTLVYTKTANVDEWDVGVIIDSGIFVDPDANDDGTMAGDLNSDGVITNDEVITEGADWASAGSGSIAAPVALGTVAFDANGTLRTITSTNGNAGSIGVDGGAASGRLQVVIDHDGIIGAAGTDADDAAVIDIGFGTIGGTEGLTQYNGSSVLNNYSQDGKQFGSLTGVSISKTGEVTAKFDNGHHRLLYQVPVTTFNNPNALEAKTGNAYIETDASGSAVAHVSGEGGAGLITPNSIESSTVDLADEFTDMITTQRAYSASTKIITTADEMLEELIRVKR